MKRKLHARWLALSLMMMLAAVASVVVVPAMGATPEGHRRGEGDFQVVDLTAPSPGRFDLPQEEPQRPDNLADVTDHPKGRSEIQRAVSAFSHIAGTQDPSVYRAYAINGNEDDILVIPHFTKVEAADIVLNGDGSATLSATLVVSAARAAEESHKNGRAPSGLTFSSYWGWWANYCFARSSSDFGYFDTCWYINKLFNDGNPSADYFSFYHWGTAGPIGGAALKDAWLQSWQYSGSAPMSWVDWSPKSDLSGNCSVTTLSISVFGVGLSANHNRCETWDITKGSAAGSFKNDWGGALVAADREVGYITVVSVPEGGNPIWALNFSHTACISWSWCDSAP